MWPTISDMGCTIAKSFNDYVQQLDPCEQKSYCEYWTEINNTSTEHSITYKTTAAIFMNEMEYYFGEYSLSKDDISIEHNTYYYKSFKIICKTYYSEKNNCECEYTLYKLQSM